MNDPIRRRACGWRAPWAVLASAVLVAGLALVASVRAQAPAGPVHDPENPELGLLQRHGDATAALPRNARGEVDWVRALREGHIRPRAGLHGDPPMEVLVLDVVMRNTKEMPHVRFPHEPHTQWLGCASCHDALFVPKAGANPMTMGEIFQGRHCGVCHGSVAFSPMLSCERCHSLPHGDVKAWWGPAEPPRDTRLPAPPASP